MPISTEQDGQSVLNDAVENDLIPSPAGKQTSAPLKSTETSPVGLKIRGNPGNSKVILSQPQEHEANSKEDVPALLLEKAAVIMETSKPSQQHQGRTTWTDVSLAPSSNLIAIAPAIKRETKDVCDGSEKINPEEKPVHKDSKHAEKTAIERLACRDIDGIQQSLSEKSGCSGGNEPQKDRSKILTGKLKFDGHKATADKKPRDTNSCGRPTTEIIENLSVRSGSGSRKAEGNTKTAGAVKNGGLNASTVKKSASAVADGGLKANTEQKRTAESAKREVKGERLGKLVTKLGSGSLISKYTEKYVEEPMGNVWNGNLKSPLEKPPANLRRGTHANIAEKPSFLDVLQGNTADGNVAAVVQESGESNQSQYDCSPEAKVIAQNIRPAHNRSAEANSDPGERACSQEELKDASPRRTPKCATTSSATVTRVIGRVHPGTWRERKWVPTEKVSPGWGGARKAAAAGASPTATAAAAAASAGPGGRDAGGLGRARGAEPARRAQATSTLGAGAPAGAGSGIGRDAGGTVRGVERAPQKWRKGSKQNRRAGARRGSGRTAGDRADEPPVVGGAALQGGNARSLAKCNLNPLARTFSTAPGGNAGSTHAGHAGRPQSSTAGSLPPQYAYYPAYPPASAVVAPPPYALSAQYGLPPNLTHPGLYTPHPQYFAPLQFLPPQVALTTSTDRRALNPSATAFTPGKPAHGQAERQQQAAKGEQWGKQETVATQREHAKPTKQGKPGGVGANGKRKKEDEVGMAQMKTSIVEDYVQEQTMDALGQVQKSEKPMGKYKPYFIPMEQMMNVSRTSVETEVIEYSQVQAVEQAINATPGYWYINGPNGKVIPGLESHPPAELARKGAIIPVDWLPVE